MKVLTPGRDRHDCGPLAWASTESWRGTGLILHGYVRVLASELVVGGHSGDLLIMPHHRHSLEALGDSAVLTVAKLP